MAHGKWYGCHLMAVCLFAIIESVQSNEPPRRIEKRQVNRLEGPDDSLNLVGTNVTFTCVSTLRSCLSLSWYKEERISTSRTRFSSINRLEASVRARIIVENTTSGCNLTLMNVRTNDNGRIYCQLYAGRSSIRGREAKLTVTTQRYALRGMSDNSSLVGDDVDFICISPLRNCIGISWYKYLRPRVNVIIFSAQEGNFLHDKYVLENSTYGCRLTIRNLDLTDNGGYICKIVISQRPVERSANLYVFGPLNRPENLMSFVGTNTTVFSCASPLKSCVNMTWYKESTSTGRTYFFALRTYRPAVRARWIEENTTVGCQLTITNAQLGDSGRFKCELRMGYRLFEGSIASLKVTTQNNALRGPPDGMHIAGRNTSLTCLSPFGDCRGMSWYTETPGTDRVTIYSEQYGIYLRDKYIVENSTDGCRLTITDLDRGDTGSVYCQIQISRRAIEKSATLIIFQRQIENPLIGPDDDTLSFINATAVFTCLSPLRSCAKINWYKHTPTTHTQNVLIAINNPRSPLRDRYVLDNSTRVCKLIIRNVQLNDAGYYTCKIILGSTSFQGKNALLTVINAPQPGARENALGLSNNFSTPGYDVSFTCVSPLRDCRGINWYKGYTLHIFKDGNVVYGRGKYLVDVSASGCELIIKNVDKGDISEVSCRIEISQRSYQAFALLIVFETKSQRNSLSFVGQTAAFTCDSPMGNCDNMTWYKQFVPVNDADSTVRGRWSVQKTPSGCKLTLINVQLTDAGRVYCEIMLGGRPIRGGVTSFTVSA